MESRAVASQMNWVVTVSGCQRSYPKHCGKTVAMYRELGWRFGCAKSIWQPHEERVDRFGVGLVCDLPTALLERRQTLEGPPRSSTHWGSGRIWPTRGQAPWRNGAGTQSPDKGNGLLKECRNCAPKKLGNLGHSLKNTFISWVFREKNWNNLDFYWKICSDLEHNKLNRRGDWPSSGTTCFIAPITAPWRK